MKIREERDNAKTQEEIKWKNQLSVSLEEMIILHILFTSD